MSRIISEISRLAGLNEDTVVPLGTTFIIQDSENMHKAIDAILAAGLEVDLAFSMGSFYFNFLNKDIAEEARKIVTKVIDKTKESNL